MNCNGLNGDVCVVNNVMNGNSLNGRCICSSNVMGVMGNVSVVSKVMG